MIINRKIHIDKDTNLSILDNTHLAILLELLCQRYCSYCKIPSQTTQDNWNSIIIVAEEIVRRK